MGAYAHRLQPGYVGVFNPDLHQVRFAVFDVADQFHFHLAHVGDGITDALGRRRGTCAPCPGETLDHVQLAGTQLGDRAHVGMIVYPDAHGQVGLAAGGREIEDADKRDRVLVDEDMYPLYIQFIGLGNFGMYGNGSERCIFRRVRHPYFQNALLGVFNDFPVLEGCVA